MRLLISACFALVLVLALRSSTPTHAQTSEAWRIFTHTDEVNAVAVVGGEVWAATEGGVVRWDTATRDYQVFTIDDHLPANQARAILHDPQTGYVWVGTAAGLAQWDGARWQKWSLPQGLCSRVDGLALDGRGRVWATTNASAALVDGVTGAVVRTCGDMFTVMPDYLDDVLAATLPSPVWAIEANRAVWTSVGPSPGISRFDHAGRTTYCNFSLFRPNPVPSECTADLPALPSNVVDAVVITPDGSRWLGTGAGLVRWRPDGSANRVGADDLPAGRVRSLTVDALGRVWLGVYGCVSVCSGAVGRVEANDRVRPFYAQAGGLPSPDVREVIAGADGVVWVATTEGLTRIHADDGVDLPYKAPGLPSQQVNAVARDRLAGVIWVGTERGLASFDQQTGQWTVYDHDTTNDLPANAVHALIMVGGDLWVATGDNIGVGQRGGVSQRLADGRWVHHTRDGQDNPLGYIQALAKEDVPLTGSGYRIWAGSSGSAAVGPQLFALDTDGRWLTWSSGTNASFGTIRDMSVRSKHVWLATQADGSRPGGLAVLDYGAAPSSGSGNWTLYTSANTGGTLLSDFVTSVAADNVGRVWIGTPLGVSRFIPDQVVNQWENYTVSNTNGGLINNFINDIAFLDDLSANGAQMWFMTQGGVSQFDTQFRRWRSWARTDGSSGVRNLTSTAYELSCKRWFGSSDGLSLLVFDACNNLGPTPTPFPTRTATFTPTPELSPTTTPTLTPSATATPLPSATATATPTPSLTLILPPSRTPTETLVSPPATLTPTASATEPEPGATDSPTPTPIPPTTATPSGTPTLSPTPSATLDPSQLVYDLYLPYVLAAHKLPPPILGSSR
ncbi:MAG: hypothetical protein KIT87_02115 [Anaerolineae bacterium]|nr:hypothetical protein [Anaerolineae bacterium]